MMHSQRTMHDGALLSPRARPTPLVRARFARLAHQCRSGVSAFAGATFVAKSPAVYGRYALIERVLQAGEEAQRAALREAAEYDAVRGCARGNLCV
jgi:hypothetical protein